MWLDFIVRQILENVPATGLWKAAMVAASMHNITELVCACFTTPHRPALWSKLSLGTTRRSVRTRPTTKTSFMNAGRRGRDSLHSLEHRLGRQHCAVDLQDLLLLDKVLPPNLQDVVLQGTTHGPEVIQTTDTCTTLLISKRTLKDLCTCKKTCTSVDGKSLVVKEPSLESILHLGSVNNVIFGL